MCSYVHVYRAHKIILRMIFNLRYDEGCRTLFKTKKVLTAVSIFISKYVCYVTKHLYMFKVQGDNDNYNTICIVLKIRKFKTSMFKNLPHYYYVPLYSALPGNVKCIDSYYKSSENSPPQPLLLFSE
nr:unnamed protein product [Callosobruchus analis]